MLDSGASDANVNPYSNCAPLMWYVKVISSMLRYVCTFGSFFCKKFFSPNAKISQVYIKTMDLNYI